ncbi:MAG: hypothetical protein KJ971_03260 [Firmicutes bacterium]|nr:hypothetical protein [Bacillota bacterium]
MRKHILYYLVIILSNTLYFFIPFPLVLILIYGVQTVFTLHIYQEINRTLGDRVKTIIGLWALSVVIQFSGIYYVAVTYFTKSIYSVIIALCLSIEIWIIAVIRYIKDRQNK